jgi:hypothetical protein
MTFDPIFLAVLVPIVTVLVRLLRLWPWLDVRTEYLPAASVAVGLVLSASWTAWTPPAGLGIGACAGYAAIHGVLAGLAASGLWSAGAKYVPLLKSD